jgi:hypothetical protein
LAALSDDAAYHLITGETSGSNERIGLRSAATGALLAQTALDYHVNGIWARDLDGDGDAEIIVWDGNTGKFNCFDYTTGSSTLAVRWSYLPFSVAGVVDFQFVDFDGDGRIYLVFEGEAPNFAVRDHNGVQVSTFSLPSHGSGWGTTLEVADYDADQREELLIRYSDSFQGVVTQEELYMYESVSAVAVEPGITEASSVQLGPSHPNPTWSLSRVEYSVPATGPATLRLVDPAGREVRTLVDGQVPAGRHEAIWDGRDANGRQVPAGVYFYQLNAGGRRASQRVVRLP